MDGIDISGAEKCMGVPVAAQPVGQADTCVAPHERHMVFEHLGASKTAFFWHFRGPTPKTAPMGAPGGYKC